MQTPNLSELATATISAGKALLDFRTAVEKMRHSQKRYFELMARAKKSKHPDDFTNARNILAISKELEKQVDEAIDQLKSNSL
jgi:hypothetical protein